MTTINDAYTNALLADASYVGGLSSTSDLVTKLRERMTPTVSEFTFRSNQ